MGMYVACQKELIRALQAAGCVKQPFISMKKLLASSESRLSAVLSEDEAIERQKGKKFFTDENGKRLKRTKIFNRDITFTVVIGDYNNEAVEEIYEKFLKELADGIYLDGNYISIEPSDTEWNEEKDHILYSKVSMQVKITCHGGIYRDTDMVQVKDIDVDVRKEG